MLALFRTNQLLGGVLLLPYLVLLRLDGFWQTPAALAPVPGFGNSWLIPWLNQYADWQWSILLLLVFVQATLANSLAFQHRLTPIVNLFPGVFVCLLCSLLPTFNVYSPYLVANVFLLLAVRSTLAAFRQMSAAVPIFNAGAWLGLATLFVPTYVWLLLPLGVALTVLKSGRFRDQLILILGLTLPHYLLGIYFFWDDQLAYFWSKQWSGVWHWPNLLPLEWPMLPGFSLLTVLLAYVLFSANNLKSKMKMEVQTKLGVLYWVLFGLGISVVFTMPWQMEKWLAMAPIAGILLSMRFTKMRAATAETWHLLLVVALLALHWSSYLL
ncbi:MAG: hypothetical protein AAGJ82_08960 [Bacteroidota bacterium]